MPSDNLLTLFPANMCACGCGLPTSRDSAKYRRGHAPTPCDYCDDPATAAHPTRVAYLVYYTCDIHAILHTADGRTLDIAMRMVEATRESERTSRAWGADMRTIMARALTFGTRFADVLADLETRLDDMPLGARASACPITLGR